MCATNLKRAGEGGQDTDDGNTTKKKFRSVSENNFSMPHQWQHRHCAKNLIQYDIAQISIGHVIFSVDCTLAIEGCELKSATSSSAQLILGFRCCSTSTGEGPHVRIAFDLPNSLEKLLYYHSPFHEKFSSSSNVLPVGSVGCESGNRDSFVALVPTQHQRQLDKLQSICPQFDPRLCVIVAKFRGYFPVEILLNQVNEIVDRSTKLIEPIQDGEEQLYYSIFRDGCGNRRFEPSGKMLLPQTSVSALDAVDIVFGRSDNETLLVYPFSGNEDSIEEAASGLNEVNQLENSILTQCRLAHLNGEQKVKERPARGHFVTITVQDYKRLDAEKEFNDTLVDFWMKWISRGDTDDVHFFSTHFYSTLADKGVPGVQTWTEKKGLDIFTRKLLFFPIHLARHWSLAVAVNAGEIETYGSTPAEDKDLPCILFFDSLKLHSPATVGKKLRGWLNFEWDRLRKGSKSPFSARSLRVFTPEVPRQDNEYDCGVFVCRYAYAMYMMRGRRFSQKAALPFGQARFGALITNDDLFAFTAVDIQRVRLELKVLVTNLSLVYKEAKDKENGTKRLTIEKHKEMGLDRKVAATTPISKLCPIATDGSTTELIINGKDGSLAPILHGSSKATSDRRAVKSLRRTASATQFWPLDSLLFDDQVTHEGHESGCVQAERKTATNNSNSKVELEQIRRLKMIYETFTRNELDVGVFWNQGGIITTLRAMKSHCNQPVIQYKGILLLLKVVPMALRQQPLLSNKLFAPIISGTFQAMKIHFMVVRVQQCGWKLLSLLVTQYNEHTNLRVLCKTVTKHSLKCLQQMYQYPFITNSIGAILWHFCRDKICRRWIVNETDAINAVWKAMEGDSIPTRRDILNLLGLRLTQDQIYTAFIHTNKNHRHATPEKSWKNREAVCPFR